MTPEPSFANIDANAGSNCGQPPSFSAERLDDADLDTLTVRWTLLVPRGEGAASVRLIEEELEPLDPPVDGVVYDFRRFELDRTKLVNALGGDLSEQAKPDHEQLLELRISDGGFKAGTDDPRDGAGLVFLSWGIKIRDVDCTTGVSP
jgi:hypothetical protein